MKHLIIFGPPGSGKGTHSERIARAYSIPHISTGDILREHLAKDTELGRRVAPYVKRGEYVPDPIVNEVVEDRLSKEECKEGFVLDGYPRTMDQVKALEEMLIRLNLHLDLVIRLNVSEDEIVRRLSARRSCQKCKAIYNLLSSPPKVEGVCDICGGPLIQREDDTPEVILDRLRVYERETKPIIEHYERRGNVSEVDGNSDIETVYSRIKRILEGLPHTI